MERIIRVEYADNSTPAICKSGIQGGCLPAIRLLNDLDPLICSGVLPDHGEGFVGRAVVTHNQLEIGVTACQYTLNRIADIAAVIVDRNQHADEWIGAERVEVDWTKTGFTGHGCSPSIRGSSENNW